MDAAARGEGRATLALDPFQHFQATANAYDADADQGVHRDAAYDELHRRLRSGEVEHVSFLSKANHVTYVI